MSTTPLLTPGEFRNQLNEASDQGDPIAVAQLAARLASRRYPWLIDDGHYYLPAYAMLCCYWENPAEFKTQVVPALGPPQSEAYWRRMATFISYIYKQHDWVMLGHLAYRIDWSLAALASKADQAPQAETDNSPERTSASVSIGLSFCQAVQAACDVTQGNIEPRNYLQVAFGYFQSLPSGLAVPPDLVEYAAADPDASEIAVSPRDWPMLRYFWKTNRGCWNLFPKSLDSLAKVRNPFLTVLAAQLRSHEEPPTTSEAATGQRAQPAQDPFQSLAREHAVNLTTFETSTRQASVKSVNDATSKDDAPRERFVRRLWNRIHRWWRGSR